MMFRRKRGTPMPAKFKELADYNADRKRLVFTPEYEARIT